MPASTMRKITLPGSNYYRNKVGVAGACEPYTSDFSTSTGRTWSGNQRRKREKFNPPTACSSLTRKPNTATIHQGLKDCETKPAFAYLRLGPDGPGSGPFGISRNGSPEQERLESIALSRFSNNTGLGVTLAETAGTLRSLGDRLLAVTRILNNLRKGDVRGALSVLHQHTGYNTSRAAARLRARPDRNYSDRASSFWLETTFGWVPLLQSIYDSLDELGRERRTDRRARASDTKNGLRAGIAAEFRTSDGNRFSSLGLVNPAEVAWDLVPFSFVLDWFLPIGDSIRFLGTRRLTTQIWMWSSRKWGTVQTCGSYLGAPVGTLVKRDTEYRRTVSVPTVATFTARLPATMWHAVTSAALIQSLRPR